MQAKKLSFDQCKIRKCRRTLAVFKRKCAWQARLLTSCREWLKYVDQTYRGGGGRVSSFLTTCIILVLLIHACVVETDSSPVNAQIGMPSKLSFSSACIGLPEVLLQTTFWCWYFGSQVQVMSGSHSEIQHTRTSVSWPSRTLVKVTMPCSAWLTKLLVANLLPQETGSSPMELEFSVQGVFTETEVIWRCLCTAAEEVERKGSTTVRYLIHWMLPSPYTLECTQQALVSAWYMLVANHHYECFSSILKHKASLGALLGVCICSLTCISMTFEPTN